MAAAGQDVCYGGAKWALLTDPHQEFLRRRHMDQTRTNKGCVSWRCRGAAVPCPARRPRRAIGFDATKALVISAASVCLKVPSNIQFVPGNRKI